MACPGLFLSGDKSWSQNLMWTVAPQVKTVEQPVQLLDAQHDGFVGGLRLCFKSLGFQALEPKAEAVALPIKYFHSVTVAIQKDEKHRVEHGDFDIQLDQSGQPVDGFSEVHGLGVEVQFFDFGVGSHHELLAPERNREHSIADQQLALNVVFMDRIQLDDG
jgi:hypothetical protein